MRIGITTITLSLLIAACSTPSQMKSKAQQQQKEYQEVIGVVDENHPKPDTFAMYPDGQNGINQHILHTFRYPDYCAQKRIQGKVYVEYFVEIDGSVKEAKIKNSVHPELDKEALRIILALERFRPGMKNNQPVRVKYSQPINFKIQ